MAELADAYASGAYGSNPLEVQVLFRAQKQTIENVSISFLFFVREEFVKQAQ